MRIALAIETVGEDAGQMLNMILGNTSMHACVSLVDVEIPPVFAAIFAGPRHGLEGLRARVGAGRRPLTATAIKPQGLPVAALADLGTGWRLAGLITSRTTTATPTRRSRPSRSGCRRIAEAVRRAPAKPGIRPAMCRC